MLITPQGVNWTVTYQLTQKRNHPRQIDNFGKISKAMKVKGVRISTTNIHLLLFKIQSQLLAGKKETV